MRLDRLLSTLAVGSRSQVKELVSQGRVQVRETTAWDAAMEVVPGEVVRVDDVPIDTRVIRHVMMNKPAGVLTAARDSKQPTVLDLLPSLYQSCGCMPVGRLDKDTEGLLLFTSDGQAAHRLLSPKRLVPKVYQARVTGRLQPDAVAAFKCGLNLGDFVSMPATLHILDAQEKSSLAEVTVCEGKFHQVKRMFSACGHEVLALKRLRFGGLQLDDTLAPGEWRELRDEEWNLLMKGVEDVAG